MGSGHPLSQGGAYPVSQHHFNVGALVSPQDNNVALVAVVQPVNRIQHMIAPEHPGECRASSSPPRWQHGNTHLKRNVQQLESPASKDWDGGVWDNPQMTGVLSSKCRTYFGSPANENSVKQSVYDAGQEGKCRYLKKSHPRLFALLTEEPTDLEISMHTSSRSEQTNVQIELSTSPLFCDNGHFKSLQVKCSLAAPQSEKSSAQILDDFGVMHSSLSPSGQPSTEDISPVAEITPSTDEQIVKKIEEQVAHYKRILTQNNGKCGHTCLSKELDCCANVMDFIFQFGSIIPNSNGAIQLPRTPPPGKEGVEKQNPNCAVNEKSAAAQALENDSKATKASTKSIPKSENTECPSIKRKVAATRAKTEHPSSLLSCSSSCEESEVFGFDIRKNLDDMEQMSASLLLRRMMEAVRLEGVQSVKAVSEETKSRSSTCENIEIHSISRTENQEMKMKSTEGQKDSAIVDAGFELSSSNAIQIRNVVSLEQPALSERDQVFSVKAANAALIEDISDDENASHLTTKLPNTQHKESNASQLYDPRYENISDDENPEMVLQRQEARSNLEVSAAEERRSICVQDPTPTIEIPSEDDRVPPKTETLDLRTCSDPRFVEGDHSIKGLSCLKYDRMRPQAWQTNHSVLKDYTEYQLDDDWMIFHISICDLTREGENQLNACPERGELQRAAPPLFSPIEEFDTKESFAEAMRLQNVSVLEVAPGSYSPEHERDLEGEEHSPQRKRGSDSEDSYDTEDSCNYPCGSERNYMTASTKASAPLDTNAAGSGSTREGEDQAADVQNRQTRKINTLAKKIREFIKVKHVSKLIQEEKDAIIDVINIDSVTEDEVTSDSGTDQSHGSEMRVALSGAKCGSDQEQRNRLNISRKESIISISSDSEEDHYQNHTKPKKRRRFSLGSTQGSQTPEMQPAAENGEQGETSASRCLSEWQGAHVKNVLQAGGSDQPESMEASKWLAEAPADCKHNLRRTSRPAQTRPRRITSSESEDSDDAFIATVDRLSTDGLCRTATKEAKTKKHSPINVTKKQDQSERDARLHDNPMIPRLFIRGSTAATGCLMVAGKAPVHAQASYDVPSRTRPDPLHVNMHEKKASKPKQMQPTKKKAKLDSRQPSLPSREAPPTSTGNSSSTSRSLSELRLSSSSSRGLPQSGETSTSSTLLKPTQCRPAVRHPSASSGLPPAHSPSNPPTSEQRRPSTKRSSSSSTAPLPASKIVRKTWENTYIPIKRDRKGSLGVGESSRTTRSDSSRETTSEASHCDKVPRQRRRQSHKPANPWVKKIKSDAIRCTRARYCDPTRKPSRTVGDNYKWSEKPTVAKATKRFREQSRSHQDHH